MDGLLNAFCVDGQGQEDCVMEQVGCSSCGLLIEEQYLMKIGPVNYHEQCVKCAVCQCNLMERCFQRDGQLYCREHYYRTFSQFRCSGCKDGIAPTDMVYKLKNGLVFHISCHCCVFCGKSLVPGEHIIVDSVHKSLACLSHQTSGSSTGKFFAMSSAATGGNRGDSSQHQLVPASFPAPSGSGGQSALSEDHGESSDMHAAQQFSLYGTPMDFYRYGCLYDDSKFLKRRGPRTTIKQCQLDVLNTTFTTSPKPSKHARAKLALETGLSMRVIQVWFQNRRSKERRLKHLCNYLRHYEQHGLIPPHGAQGGMIPSDSQSLASPVSSSNPNDNADFSPDGNDGNDEASTSTADDVSAFSELLHFGELAHAQRFEMPHASYHQPHKEDVPSDGHSGYPSDDRE